MNRSSLVIGVTALALALATAGVLMHPPATFQPSLRLPLAGQILPAQDVPGPAAPTTDPDDGGSTWAALIEETGDDSRRQGAPDPSGKPGRRKGSDVRVHHERSDDSEDAERSEGTSDDEESEARVSASSTGSDDSHESETGSSH